MEKLLMIQNNYITLKKTKNIYSFLEQNHLQKTFKNSRTEIWENDEIQISIDKTIIRILIFDKNKIMYYKNLISKI